MRVYTKQWLIYSAIDNSLMNSLLPEHFRVWFYHSGAEHATQIASIRCGVQRVWACLSFRSRFTWETRRGADWSVNKQVFDATETSLLSMIMHWELFAWFTQQSELIEGHVAAVVVVANKIRLPMPGFSIPVSGFILPSISKKPRPYPIDSRCLTQH